MATQGRQAASFQERWGFSCLPCEAMAPGHVFFLLLLSQHGHISGQIRPSGQAVFGEVSVPSGDVVLR
jgi:hypothetical protein